MIDEIVVFQSSNNKSNLISVVVIPVAELKSLTSAPTLSGAIYNFYAIN